MEKAENIFGGVYLISDKALFEQTISARPDPGVFHVYLGYAGWTQDQLRTEAQLGAWFVFPAEAATVFNSDPDSLWLQMIQKTELQLAKTENALTFTYHGCHRLCPRTAMRTTLTSLYFLRSTNQRF
jgi:putative AlgH/UPF0301 family transcriptional regulator